MADYSLGVAIFDFVPVLTSAVGLAFLARGIAARHRALATAAWGAMLLIPFGGLCKASWKLKLALTGEHTALLENLLFIALAPGFVVMAFCLYHARRAWQAGVPAAGASYPSRRLALWLALPMGIAALAAYAYPDSRLWFFWLLGITTAANASLILQALLASRWSGLPWAVSACFLYNFAATLALSGLSRLPPGNTTAWIQEGVNLSAQAALAAGLWHLGRRMQQRGTTP